jgi:hypothetical protein
MRHIFYQAGWSKMAGFVGICACGTRARAGEGARATFGILYWWKRSNTFGGCGAALRGI